MTDVARFEALRARLGELRGRSRALARQLGNVDLGELRGPADLALIPVMRKSAIASQQAAEPPFGAFAAAPTSAFPRLFASPGGIYEPESAGRDPWGAAKALAAAGVTAGEIVVNCFSYHLTPGGRILESGALAARLPRDPRRSRQYRAPHRCDRASQAQRLLRPAGLPQDCDRQGACRGRRRLVPE
jgi:phenylacetate-CoA ligase